MRKPIIDKVAPNVTRVERTPYTNLPIKQVKMVHSGTNKPVAPTNLFGSTSGCYQPSLSPLNRK